MQMNFFALLAMYVASQNGIEIATWVWVVAWVLTTLRFASIVYTSVKEIKNGR